MPLYNCVGGFISVGAVVSGGLVGLRSCLPPGLGPGPIAPSRFFKMLLAGAYMPSGESGAWSGACFLSPQLRRPQKDTRVLGMLMRVLGVCLRRWL